MWINWGTFFISGVTWTKYHAAHPWGTLEEFWAHKECVYELRNVQSKRFFADFQCDKEKLATTLAERALQRKTKRILDTERPYRPAEGLLEPKPEPVDEAPKLAGFMYRSKGDTMPEGN